MAADDSFGEARLRWQCRRGMRELDVLLTRYLENEYPGTSAGDKAAFAELLTLSDPELIGYLLKGETCDRPPLERILVKLRN